MNWKQIDNFCNNRITRLDVFVLCKLCTVLECKIDDLLGYGYDEMTQQYVDYMSEKIDQAMDSRIEQLQNQLAQLQRENAELKKENAKLHKAPIRKNLNLIKSL